MTNRTIAYVLCLVLATVAVPLILRLVAPNEYYGFRTAVTLSDPEKWYAANFFAGCALVMAAMVAALGIWWAPDSIVSSYRWLPFAIIVVSVVIAVFTSHLYLGRQQ